MNKRISKNSKWKSVFPYFKEGSIRFPKDRTLADVFSRVDKIQDLSTSKPYTIVKIEVEKPLIKEWGKNRLEITPIETIIPQAFDVSPRLKEYQPSKQMIRIANILKKSHIKSLQRVGNDLIEL